MRDGHGECVRGVAWWAFGEAQKHADHLGDLVLVGSTSASNRKLHSRGGILGCVEPSSRHHQEPHAPGVTELGGCAGITRKKERLDGRGVRQVLFHRRDEATLDEDESFAEGECFPR